MKIAPVFKERRLTQRNKLTGLMPGRLVMADADGNESYISCRPVDVSKDGVGLIISAEIRLPAIVRLVVQDRSIPLTVAWSKPDFSKRDLLRYGLVTVNPEDDLEQLFERTGCLVPA